MNKDDIKICANCIYYDGVKSRKTDCFHPENKSIDVVSGNITYLHDCNYLRTMDSLCGFKAHWYEKKEGWNQI